MRTKLPPIETSLCHNTPMGVIKRFSAEVSAGEDRAPAILAALAAAEGFAEATGLGLRDRQRLLIVVEELVANVLRHGGAARTLECELTLEEADEGVSLTLIDDGNPFDPTAEREFAGPDPGTGGGVGLALVRDWACRMAYARNGERNRLALVIGSA